MNRLLERKQTLRSLETIFLHLSFRNSSTSEMPVDKGGRTAGKRNQTKNIAILDHEADQLQQTIFKRTKLNPRDQFGSLGKIRMPQTESVKKAYQPDIWNQGTEFIRIVKEREKTFREKLDDEFAEGRAVQITEPQYVTIKHTLKKAKRLQLWRADKRESIKSGLPIPPPPKIADGIVKAKQRTARKERMEAAENVPRMELVPKEQLMKKTTPKNNVAIKPSKKVANKVPYFEKEEGCELRK